MDTVWNRGRRLVAVAVAGAVTAAVAFALATAAPARQRQGQEQGRTAVADGGRSAASDWRLDATALGLTATASAAGLLVLRRGGRHGARRTAPARPRAVAATSPAPRRPAPRAAAR
ncbi:hypothetical protein C9F11_06020 [Streptomyces sp. YIM 121038]|uniref:hypothetical protein n=1 Tax=Streptomyces sp. YIM 121038 TaxID=2136401 RepID=UPI0011108C20|nr:hypothetical protein [Streptomyces sp. YIM 121038]QCX74904.1 hypothetical protein C9F11_06020 [Streptomyces sp. YIM 121038]